MKSAADQMYERGVAHTSTEDMLVGAVVSNSQLYHYFTDKKALVRAVIPHQTQKVLADQEPFCRHLDFESRAACSLTASRSGSRQSAAGSAVCVTAGS